MTTSILTNSASLLGQRNVNTFGQISADINRQISSGQRVSTPVDDASNFAIAQGLRTDVRAIDALIQELGDAKGVAEVGLAAATTTSELLNDIREKIVQGVNEGMTGQQRAIVDNDYQNMLNRMRQILENAVFNDTNIVIETAIPFNTIVGQVNDQDILSSIDGDRIVPAGGWTLSSRCWTRKIFPVLQRSERAASLATSPPSWGWRWASSATTCARSPTRSASWKGSATRWRRDREYRGCGSRPRRRASTIRQCPRSARTARPQYREPVPERDRRPLPSG